MAKWLSMEKITSTTNEKIKEVAKLAQKKYRTESGLFLAEGVKVIEQAHKSGFDIKNVYVIESKVEKYNFIKDKLIVVNEAVMKKISTTDSPPDAVAVVVQKKYSIKEHKNAKRILLLENIKDAGNLGTIIRTACAFDMDAIILAGDCVDIYNPKVVRATVGNLFQIPILQVENVTELKKLFPEHALIATVVRDEATIALDKIDFKKPFIIAFGSEADGLSDELIKNADLKTTIEHNKNVESLNLSTAVAIVAHAATV